MKRLHVIVLASAMLAGCATLPEARIETKNVEVPVPVHCNPAIGPEPVYADTPAALRAAPDIFARVQLLLEGRLQRMQRLTELSAAIKACM